MQKENDGAMNYIMRGHICLPTSVCKKVDPFSFDNAMSDCLK